MNIGSTKRGAGAEPRLVGRAAELSRLADWVAEVAAGRGRAVLVEGEPGIGKSALLRAVAGVAADAGTAVFQGSGEELGQAFPLRPLLDAFRVRELSADPYRRDVLTALRAQQAGAAAAAAEALLDLVDQVCTQSPAVLVVDDLHWADAATVSMCHRLAQSTVQRPLLLIGAMRPLPRRDDLKALRAEVGRAQLLSLEPLPQAAVRDLVTDLAGGRPGPSLLRLAADAAGNPLYVTELVGALDRGDGLVRAGRTVEVTGGPAPATLTAAINDRLRFLPEPTRHVLQAAALLGGEFTGDDLAVVIGRRPAALAQQLAEARTAGVLVDAGPRMAFRHPLIRAALYDDLPPSVRAAWHRDAARALHQAGASVERVARQLLPALPTLDDWAIGWLLDASPALLGESTPVAVDLLEAARARTRPGDSVRVVLSAKLAEGLFRLGRIEQAAQLAGATLPDADDAALFTATQVLLARCRVLSGDVNISLAELKAALARPDLTPRHRGLLRARSARDYAFVGQIEAAEQAAREALGWVGDRGDAEITAQALLALAICRSTVGDDRGALELSNRVVAAVDGNPDLVDLLLVGLANQGIQLMVLDRVEEAEAALRRVQSLSDRTGNHTRHAHAAVWLAVLMFETGRWDDALTESALTAGFTGPYERCHAEGVTALIALHRGDVATARRHLSAADSYAGQLPQGTIAGYLCSARACDREHSEALGDALAIMRGVGYDIQETEGYLADAVRLAITLGDRAAAAELTARAEGLPSRADIPHRQAAVLHCRGLLDAMPDLLLQAADRYSAAHRSLPRAQALEAAAALLAERGEMAAARQQYLAAMDGYAALGAAWDLTRAQARFRPYGLRQPAKRLKRPTTGWAALTPAEAKVAELVAAGLSNPGIAKELGIARATVAYHVGNVLAKLQLRSRVDLALAAAARHQQEEQ